MEDRKKLKEKSDNEGDKVAKKESKKKGRKIKKALTDGKKLYYQKDFGKSKDVSSAWRTAKVILGEHTNGAPTIIKITSANAEVGMVTSPRDWQIFSTVTSGRKLGY